MLRDKSRFNMNFRALDSLKKITMLRLIYWICRSTFLKFTFRWQFKEIYRGKNIQIIGLKKIKIGRHSSLGDYFWMNINNDGVGDRKMNVFIGEYSNFGRNNFITVGDHLAIGDFFFSSCYCSIIGASHQASNPFMPYIIADVVDLGSGINIGSNVFMGAHSMIVGSVNIGFGSIIGSGSIVTTDIPPLCMVVGVPAKIVKRYCIISKQWVSADHPIDNNIISEAEYLNMIKSKHPSIPVPYHAASAKMGWL
jgi:acetyltransferase-like isoleucine patch superfamily enzyme